MVPVVLASQSLEVLLQQRPHLDDAVCHALDLSQPLLVQGLILEDSRGNTSAVNGRVGVQRAHENLELAVDALLLLRVGGDDGEGTNTFTVETLV